MLSRSRWEGVRLKPKDFTDAGSEIKGARLFVATWETVILKGKAINWYRWIQAVYI